MVHDFCHQECVWSDPFKDFMNFVERFTTLLRTSQPPKNCHQLIPYLDFYWLKWGVFWLSTEYLGVLRRPTPTKNTMSFFGREEIGLLFPGGFFECCCWSECFDLRIVVPVSGNNMKLPKNHLYPDTTDLFIKYLAADPTSSQSS